MDLASKVTPLVQVFSPNANLKHSIPPDTLSVDKGKEGVGTGNVCCPDGTHSRGGHPDVPRAMGLDVGTEDAGRKEQLPSKRDWN